MCSLWTFAETSYQRSASDSQSPGEWMFCPIVLLLSAGLVAQADPWMWSHSAATAVYSVVVGGPQRLLLKPSLLKPGWHFSAWLSRRPTVLSRAASLCFRWEPVSQKCLTAARWRLTAPRRGFIQTLKVRFLCSLRCTNTRKCCPFMPGFNCMHHFLLQISTWYLGPRTASIRWISTSCMKPQWSR